ncbi:DUF1062 domain-containing protein, partial [Salmonella enterica subsp. enterica serovar Kentucky]|nr:DUF1062 domain-containing protein [Salmonella enterica subsp. enterica serovar Kentucky]
MGERPHLGKPCKINRGLYGRLMANDAATVQYFAYDNAILKRNNAELSGQPDF